MKTHVNIRTEANFTSESSTRHAELRFHSTKPMEHRHVRRKIREQLRRLDWLTVGEDEMFA